MAPARKTKQSRPDLQSGTLHVEWFPAYGIRIREMPHVVVIGSTEVKALQYLAALGYNERRFHNTDYNMVFTNDVFETE